MFCNITFPERRFAYVPRSLVAIKRDDVTRAAARFRERFSLLSRSETIASYDLSPPPLLPQVYGGARTRPRQRNPKNEQRNYGNYVDIGLATVYRSLSASRGMRFRLFVGSFAFRYSRMMDYPITSGFFSPFSPSSPSFALPCSLFNRFPSELTQNHNNGHSAGARQAGTLFPRSAKQWDVTWFSASRFRAREDTRDLIHILE